MMSKIINKILSYSRKIFFEKISPKFKKNSLKGIIDFSYVLFEKIAIKFNIISINYLNLYTDLVQKEIKMAGITSSDSIIVIGCGSLPSTTLIISMKTNAKIIAIDKDKKAINQAKIFLSNKNMNSKIELKYANGLDYPLDEFDVIIILYGVKNLEKFFDYMYDNVKTDARIIVRTNNEMNDSFFNKFKVGKNVESKYLGQVKSYLIKK
jgi:2-polyprenyl-3-methyl-5-hydroxy-6-metoxy-1,4-benzoquinol methylase